MAAPLHQRFSTMRVSADEATLIKAYRHLPRRSQVAITLTVRELIAVRARRAAASDPPLVRVQSRSERCGPAPRARETG